MKDSNMKTKATNKEKMMGKKATNSMAKAMMQKGKSRGKSR